MSGKIAVIRDVVLLVFGLAGIAYQQVTGNVNFVLLAIFTAMTGVPGLTNLMPLLRGIPTVSHSSPSASEQPSTDSESSPPK